MSDSRKREGTETPAETPPLAKLKFEVYGEEMIEKKVMRSGVSGRVYLPFEWLGRRVVVIKMD